MTSPANALARGVSPYTRREKVLRVAWWFIGQPLFRMSFHNWYGVRRAILRAFGAGVGRAVRIRPTVRIEQPWNLSIGDDSSVGDRAILYCLGKVTIGTRVSISQHAHLCAGNHDYTDPQMPLLRPPIAIEDEAWIAADAFVGPGVRVGAGAILGARGCAFKSLEPWTVYGGNPARAIKGRERPGARGRG
ncbi:MAG TPA: colanic acid biosynthesis acetyltransferase WcaF [Phycisphaerales bacterium]|nr:colanic acid biosynthesis acetyltransferase WcaF [Phycisphaerales bacterium]